MIVVIFEVQFNSGKESDYFSLANTLRNALEQSDGFISSERFESMTTAGKFISVSFWRDAEAVKKWRNQNEHRHAQGAGRSGIIAEYRIRVASVIRDYTLSERDLAPEDSIQFFGD